MEKLKILHETASYQFLSLSYTHTYNLKIPLPVTYIHKKQKSHLFFYGKHPAASLNYERAVNCDTNIRRFTSNFDLQTQMV